MQNENRKFFGKVMIINGSPHEKGTTSCALEEIEKALIQEGIEAETIFVGKETARGCVACRACRKLGKCVQNDIVNDLADKLREADGLIIGSPVYYSSPNGTLLSILDRLFFSTSFDKRMKVGASVVVARRGGCTAAFDQLNKYFSIAGMPIAPSQYWNIIHGATPGQAELDAEGMQTMRTLARNMVFLILRLIYFQMVVLIMITLQKQLTKRPNL